MILLLVHAVACFYLGSYMAPEMDLKWPFLKGLLWKFVNYGPEPVRTLGKTRFAQDWAYPSDVRLSEENRREYFRDGWTIVRGALKPETLRALREHIVNELGDLNGMWSHASSRDSDSIMDFYVYSSLGVLAAQLFQTPNTQTAADPPSAALWRDFHYFRKPGVHITSWHIDGEDCTTDFMRSNQTRLSLMRAWTPLDDNVTTPVAFNESRMYEEFGSETLLNGSFSGRFQAWLDSPKSDQEHNLYLSLLVPTQRIRLGDVVLHSPCTMHMSPMPDHNSTVAILFPTYAPATTVLEGWGWKLLGGRACQTRRPGRQTVGDDPECFPRAYPPEARPKPGDKLRPRFWGLRSTWLTWTLLSTRFGFLGVSPAYFSSPKIPLMPF